MPYAAVHKEAVGLVKIPLEKRNEVYINFKNNESAKRVFEGDLDVDRITMDLSALMPGARFAPRETIAHVHACYENLSSVTCAIR